MPVAQTDLNPLIPAEGFFVVMMLMFVVGFVVWVASLIDALRIGDPVWTAAQQNKLLWVLLIALLGLIGALLYLVIARPSLKRANATTVTAGA